MMLLILDKDPIKSAILVPNKIKFKQLLELCQLLNSEFNLGYMKSIPQGKDLRNWIRNNMAWVFEYYRSLAFYCFNHVNLKPETLDKICNIGDKFWNDYHDKDRPINTAVFRYSKEYTNTIYKSGTELPIDECIKEYQRYLRYKKSKSPRYYN